MEKKIFRRAGSDYHSKIEKGIEEELGKELPTIGIEKEPPMLNQSSYVIRPDFRLEKDGKIFIIESKNKIKPNDVASVSGTYSGLNAQPIIISQEEPTENTSHLANKLNIKLISGSPDKVVRKLKDLINES